MLAALLMGSHVGSRAADLARPLLIGHSSRLTGAGSDVGTALRDATLAHFNFVNAAGGVNGRKLQLAALDDGGDDAKTLHNTRRLVETMHVAGLVNYSNGNAMQEVLGYLDGQGLPLIGVTTGSQALHSRFSRSLYNVRVGYGRKIAKTVEHLATTNQSRIAIVHRSGESDRANVDIFNREMAKHGKSVLGTAVLERDSTNVASAVAAIRAVRPQTVVFFNNSKPFAEFIRAFRSSSQGTQFVAISAVGPGFVKDLGADAHGVLVVQVVPLPTAVKVPLVADYRRQLEALDSRIEPSLAGVEGFIAARTLVEGLRRAGGNPTAATLSGALDNLRHFELGGYPISFMSTNHNGSNYVDISIISANGHFMS